MLPAQRGDDEEKTEDREARTEQEMSQNIFHETTS